MIRIGYYDDSASLGGTTQYLFDLLDGLDRDRFQPHFFAPVSRSWHQRLSERDVPVHLAQTSSVPQGAVQGDTPSALSPGPAIAGPPPPLPWLLGLLSEIRTLRRLFGSLPVDILHSNNVGAEAAPIAARSLRRCVIGTLHVDPSYDVHNLRSSFRFRQFERACFQSLHHAISVSARTRQMWMERCGLGQHFLSRSTVVHNGINSAALPRRRTTAEAKASLGLDPKTLVLASMGRLEAMKGYHTLLLALPSVLAAVPQTKLLIAGKGPELSSLQELAASLGISSNVRFLGFLSEKRDILEAADLYVQPSLAEVFPYALLEACSMGLAPLASAVGGMPEAVPEDAACLFPAGDAAALASRLTFLLTHPVERRNLALRAQEKVHRQFTLEKMRTETYAVYERLARSASPALR